MFGLDFPQVEMVVGWARFYQVGAALCHLYDVVFPDWHSVIEDGYSLTDILIDRIGSDEVLDLQAFEIAVDIERGCVEAGQAEVNAALQQIQQNGTMRLQYGTETAVSRAFNPSTMISLGDGRMLHRDKFGLLLPEQGNLHFVGVPAIDDVVNGELQFGACLYNLSGDVLHIETEWINGALSGVRDCGEGVFCIE